MVRTIPNRCLARRPDGRQCYSTGVRHALGIPLCERHAVAMAELFGSSDPVKIVEVAMLSPHVVYYAGNPVEQAVKIGTSHDFRARYVALRSRYPELKLLAVEPGHFDLETARHYRFRHLRLSGRGAQREWFHKTPELMEHVREIHARWGDPFSYQPGAALTTAR